jgi:serine/threonine kinase 16
MRVDGVDENVRVAKGRQGGADEDDETEQQQPLMTEDERMPAAVPGALRSYAHRDIKPGQFTLLFSLSPFTTIH